jgi:gluconolactonase
MDAVEQWVLAQGLCNVEGPTVGPEDWILNVNSLTRPEQPGWPTRAGDVTATRISRPNETYRIFSTAVGVSASIPAELAFGPGDCIFIPDEGRRSIVRVTPSLQVSDYVTEFEGHRLNGPNGLCFDDLGNLYFTDPWTSSPLNPIAGVYGRSFATGELFRIDSGMQFTNGIAVWRNGLFVAETFTRKVWRYELDGLGGATGREEFCELPDVPNLVPLEPAVQRAVGVESICGPDGIAFDETGRLYVAHYGSFGVYVYRADGSLESILTMPGRNVTNICFGGANRDQLFATVDDLGQIVCHELGTTGARLPFEPGDASPWFDVLHEAERGEPLVTPK